MPNFHLPNDKNELQKNSTIYPSIKKKKKKLILIRYKTY